MIDKSNKNITLLLVSILFVFPIALTVLSIVILHRLCIIHSPYYVNRSVACVLHRLEIVAIQSLSACLLCNVPAI